MNEARMEVPQRLDQEAGEALRREVREHRPGRGDVLVFDFSSTEHIDPVGAACLIEMAHYARRRKAEIRLEGQEGSAAEFVDLVAPALESEPAAKPTAVGMFEELGEVTLDALKETRQFFSLCVDALYWLVIAPFEGRGFRWALFVDELHEMGVRAVRIVGLMNFLLGLIIAMLSAAQVASWGLSIYVADLMMIGFARELAAIMTAVVVSARTGAAIAAELATMKVQEEIDALRGMGLNVTQFLVVPRLAALLVALPCLVVLGLLCGLAGGTVWGVVVLGFRPSVWIQQTINAAFLSDFAQGFLKTFFFAVAIALIGCHNGLRVSGGSRGVGLMTTRAVVMDIFMIICIDIIFAAIFYYVLA